jgi:two-component system sensor histidine kinase KdpD
VTVAVPDDLPPVLADAVLIDVIVTNLLDNIAAHTPQTAAVDVTARLQQDGRVALIVADAGGGVRSDLLPTLFERFRRAGPQREGSRRGLGIGLSVVRGLVEAMGGEVAAGPSAAGGLEITVLLRATPAEPAPAGPSPAEPCPAERAPAQPAPAEPGA